MYIINPDVSIISYYRVRLGKGSRAGLIALLPPRSPLLPLCSYWLPHPPSLLPFTPSILVYAPSKAALLPFPIENGSYRS